MNSRCPVHACATIGFRSDFLCPKCLSEASQPGLAVINSQHERARIAAGDRRFADAGIPDLFLSASFGSFTAPCEKASTVARALQAYATHFDQQRSARNGFVFYGAPGTGKSHLACAVAKAVLQNGFTARYASLPTLTVALRAAYFKRSQSISVQDIIRSLTAPDLLVLDEIDLHGSSGADYQSLYEIINTRYETGGKPTIALSNRHITELERDLDERITTRILSGFPALYFDWEGRRDLRKLASQHQANLMESSPNE